MTAVAAWAVVGFGAGAAFAPAAWLLMYRKTRALRLIGATATLTAAAFALIASASPDLPDLLAASTVAAIGIQLAAIDVVEQRLPRELIWPLLAATVSVLATSAIISGESARLATALAATCASVGFHYGLALASRGGIGAGDVRLAAPLAFLLGWHDWHAAFAGILLSFAATTAAAGFTRRDHRRRTTFPHGPSMIAGTMIALLC